MADTLLAVVRAAIIFWKQISVGFPRTPALRFATMPVDCFLRCLPGFMRPDGRYIHRARFHFVPSGVYRDACSVLRPDPSHGDDALGTFDFALRTRFDPLTLCSEIMGSCKGLLVVRVP